MTLAKIRMPGRKLNRVVLLLAVVLCVGSRLQAGELEIRPVDVPPEKTADWSVTGGPARPLAKNERQHVMRASHVVNDLTELQGFHCP
ncbi:hypothetical protein [Cupriavidus sp. YAF13]|uniref:hypothetical protein n=1 Tax=Cupriavidus sp. YAF13 TaxID=3233075 RepID=UPI003F8DC6BC